MFRSIGCLILLAAGAQAVPVPPPECVAVIYNSSSSDSKALAKAYIEARQIPPSNLIGLPMAEKEEISREEFNKDLLEPLKAEFDKRDWWDREKDSAGNLQPRANRIRIITCMFGVPSRIAALDTDPKMKPGGQPPVNTSEAAVDSELTLLGFEGKPIANAIPNPYFKMEAGIIPSRLPLTLVGRIDGPSRSVCERMIRDAVATEKTGLWGMAVVDIAKKYPNVAAGDPSLENIARLHGEIGIPTLVDRFPDTLPLNFPLRDPAIYYGWYDWHVSGPFLNTDFHFKKGAVAVHLHSFSAAQLRDPSKNWCAPLLARGAAATLGNVYEPYLEMTHHFDVFQARLLAGYTLVEAAYMAAPVLSWQNVVLGDPLYRPFLHLDGSGEKSEADREYRAIRVATERWKDDPQQLDAMLREGADRLKSGVMLESLGLMERERGRAAEAAMEFQKAKSYFTDKSDRLRMDLQVAAIDRAEGRNAAAVKTLRGARTLYHDLPEAAAAQAWLNIIDPPAPPPAAPPR